MSREPSTTRWERIDRQWLHAPGIGAVRGPASWRPGGWWFLAAWLPDTEEHDIGPFPTKRDAIRKAEELAYGR